MSRAPVSAAAPAAGMPAARRGAALAWGGLGVLAFSLSLPMTRIAIDGGFDPAFVGFGRTVVAALLAALVLALGRAPWPARQHLPGFGLVVLGVVIGFPLFSSLALGHVSAAHGTIVSGLLPAATAVAAVLRAGERPSLPFWLAAGAGVLCVLLFALLSGGGRFDRGDVDLMIAVGLCSFGYAEGARLSRIYGGTRVISWALVLALPLTAILAAASLDPGRLASVTPRGWAAFAYVAAVSQFAGFFAWYRGLAQGGIARIGQIQLAQPVLSLLWSALLVGETLTAGMGLAAALVLACVVLTQRTR